MSYLLDTCVVIDLVRGHQKTIEILKTKTPSQVYISAVTESELLYGLLQNPNIKSKSGEVLKSFLAEVNILVLGSDEARISAELRYGLKKLGTPRGAYDVLIAATALAYSFVLVTSNEKEFQRVPDLVIENWR